nr:MAG: replication initiator protein [Microviridae sp.]
MCLCPFPNTNINSLAYKNKIYEFACGHCPECLQSRIHRIIPGSFYEALSHKRNCMITLTYDNFERDKYGRLTGRELPPNRDLHVCRRDVTLFIKRLRKYLSTHYDGLTIKYRGAAEYGSTTHRAHYHLIIYGFDFPDRKPYKLSNRGNHIYTSALLTSLWRFGICTVDSVNVNSNVIAYCSKYLSKDRSEDTFSLSSHHLGHELLLKNFNGVSYFIDGKEYPIPRSIWNKKLEETYSSICPEATSKYVNFSETSYLDGSYRANQKARALFYALKRCDPSYTAYLAYWSQKAKMLEASRLPTRERILALPNKKLSYKLALLKWYDENVLNRIEMVPKLPPLCEHKSERAYARYLASCGIKYRDPADRHLPYFSCLNTANDTTPHKICFETAIKSKFLVECSDLDPFTNPEKFKISKKVLDNEQLSLL